MRHWQLCLMVMVLVVTACAGSTPVREPDKVVVSPTVGPGVVEVELPPLPNGAAPPLVVMAGVAADPSLMALHYANSCFVAVWDSSRWTGMDAPLAVCTDPTYAASWWPQQAAYRGAAHARPAQDIAFYYSLVCYAPGVYLVAFADQCVTATWCGTGWSVGVTEWAWCAETTPGCPPDGMAWLEAVCPTEAK